MDPAHQENGGPFHPQLASQRGRDHACMWISSLKIMC